MAVYILQAAIKGAIGIDALYLFLDFNSDLTLSTIEYLLFFKTTPVCSSLRLAFPISACTISWDFARASLTAAQYQILKHLYIFGIYHLFFDFKRYDLLLAVGDHLDHATARRWHQRFLLPARPAFSSFLIATSGPASSYHPCSSYLSYQVVLPHPSGAIRAVFTFATMTARPRLHLGKY